MAHFAFVKDGVVKNVIVSEPDVLPSLPRPEEGGDWVETCPNTHAGHNPTGVALRKNYAGIGYTYDAQRDAFIPPKPFASWVLNETTGLWDAPVARPDDGMYDWNESTTQWVRIDPIA